jgi:aromatic ring-opening dioxygenase catalytic subunit (LigB family)
MPRRVPKHDQAAERVADEHRLLVASGLPQHRLEFVDNRRERARSRWLVAPRETRAIVRAHGRELGDLRLDQSPAHRRCGDA